jgi:hypothetical protein
MPITLTLTGRCDLLPAPRLTRSEARDWLARAAVWFEGLGDAVLDARVGRDGEDRPVLLVTFHPAAPPVEVRRGATGKVRVTAATTPAGPGYHVHLCERLRQFAADFDLTWDDAETRDPTGYFEARDRAAVGACFRDWLREQCAALAPHAGTDTRLSLGLPAAHGFTHPGAVLTPLGPRDAGWLAAVAADPAAGTDYFPWRTPDLDAAFYRNRAAVRLWCEFPWRPPLTEEEGELADQVANDLATAFKLDPAAELPWREWLEVLAAVENDDDGFTVTPTDPALTETITQRSWEADASAPAVGYRRHPVRVPLTCGWSVEVPGDFAREWDDARTWTGWNRTRTVWFHALGFTKPDGSPPTAAEAVEMGRRSLPDGDPVGPLVRGDIRGEAVFGPADEDGRTVWRVSGVAAVAGQLVVCNVYTEEANDRAWAVRTWEGLRHTPAPEVGLRKAE